MRTKTSRVRARRKRTFDLSGEDVTLVEIFPGFTSSPGYPGRRKGARQRYSGTRVLLSVNAVLLRASYVQYFGHSREALDASLNCIALEHVQTGATWVSTRVVHAYAQVGYMSSLLDRRGLCPEHARRNP